MTLPAAPLRTASNSCSASYDRWLTLLDIPVPVIAAIEGECIGVAPIFACASDVTIADDTAKFQITFTALGLFPGMAMAYRTVICTKMPYEVPQRSHAGSLGSPGLRR